MASIESTPLEKELTSEEVLISNTVIFKSNEMLDWLVRYLSSVDDGYLSAADRYFCTRLQRGHSISNMHRSQIAELGLQQILREISAQVIHMQADPIAHKQKSVSFQFLRDQVGNISAYEIKTRRQVAEYDALAIIDGLPTVFDIKMIQNPNHVGTATIGGKLDKSFAPLIEYFGQNVFGYVVVTPHDVFDDRNRFQKKLMNGGGLLLSYPFSRKAYIPLAASMRNKYGFKTYPNT